MARTDERQPTSLPAAHERGRTHGWIAPLLGAVLGFVLGTAVVSLAAAYLPEGSGWFSGTGLMIQIVGALLGGAVGAIAGWRS